MTLADRVECSAISLAVAESPVGTASRYRHWLMLEQPGPWGHDALVESQLPLEVGRLLRERGRAAGVRVLLIKNRTRLVGPRQCFAVYTGSQRRWVRSFEVTDPAELLDLDLHAQVTQRFVDLGDAFERPLSLVCTHGKHDPCCARHGAPLFRALEGLPDVWECTHIGGDRFAGNIVCFPHGFYFGRVPASAGRRVVQAYARGEIVLDHFRGRSAYSPPVQAAEERIRRTFGLIGVDDLVLVRHVGRERPAQRVEFRGRNWERYAAEVEVSTLEPRPLTCKVSTPHSPRAYTVRDVED
ncbi:MAG: sucrase ferredoxin [Actinomycetota bacterium]|nr:sucrase ferredoxin [Actinomycetota bacterium]